MALPDAALAADADPEWGANQARPVGPPRQTDIVGSASTEGVRRSGGQADLMAAAATPGWVLHGAGWGHGIGMSQYGAYEMAKDGYSAAQILAHYYQGTTYNAVTDTQALRVNIAASAGSATLTSVSLNSGGAFRVSVAGSSAVMNGAAGGQVTFGRSGSQVTVTCGTCTPVTT